MRVVYVAPFGLRQKTTVWARWLPLARRLLAHGIEPAILIPPWDSPADAGSRGRDAGVEVVQVALAGGLPAIAARLLRELGRRHPDLVHVIKPRAYAGIVQYALWQRRRLGLRTPPLLLDLDDWEQAWAAVNHYPKILARGLAWQEEWGIRHADGITAASHWLHAKAQDYAQNTPLLYLPNGVDLPAIPAGTAARPVPAVADRPPTVLYFSRYVETTPAWLADFWAALAARVPTARLIVAGQPLQVGADAPFRAAMATRNSAAAQVYWLGGVPAAALPGIYAASDVAIFPALPTPLQLAKCSVRLANTLLHGVPVVAAAVGEQAHFGANGAACLLPPLATPGEFAAATAHLLQHPTEAQTMAAAARRHLAQHYQWHDLAARLAAFYATFAV